MGDSHISIEQKGHFARLDAARFPQFHAGSVWLVGAGPGDPALIPLLAYHGLGQADIVVYDALVSPGLLAMVPEEAERHYAGKRGGKPSPSQADISLFLIEQARTGKKVLRLKGGDPFMFGRGGEESETLARAGIPFRIVPGITAGIGGLAYAGIPVTHRDTNHAVIFLTGHDDKGGVPQGVDWQAVATAAPVIVMYMAVKHIASIAKRLIDGGRTPQDRLAVIANATLPDQVVIESTLGDITARSQTEPLPTPAIVIIGPVIAYREILDWYRSDAEGTQIG